MVRSITPAGRSPGPLSRVSWGGAFATLALMTPTVVLGAWLAVHRIPGVGPWLADSLRLVVGIEAVARLEDAAYGAEDRFYRVWRRGEPPRAHWAVPLLATSSSRAAPPTGGDEQAPAGARGESEPFAPTSVGPVHAACSAPGDGQWVLLPDATPPDPARMYKTLLHPDPSRSWAELFVVAIDLRRVRLFLVPGTREPQATLAQAQDFPRTGLVPEEHQAAVLAAFNGGFKTEHGHYGMATGGVTLVPPQGDTCTISYFKDHTLRIGTWQTASGDKPVQPGETLWWRQTPRCMVEDGSMNPLLAAGNVHRWGSTLDGDTVIRRSAIGLDAAGNTLLVGISNHTTAQALALGMSHAGARAVAQLDINFSFPKFVTFRPSRISRLRWAVPLADGFEYSEHEYLRKASNRDFFYVTAAEADARTASQ